MDLTNKTFQSLGKLIQNNPEYEHRTGNDTQYQDFLAQYPAEKLSQLTLAQYCLGKDSQKGNFSWWIDRGLESVLGRYSPGTSRGHILYNNKDGTLYKNRALSDMSDPKALAYILKIHQLIAQADPQDDLTWLDDDSKIYAKAGLEPRMTMGNGRKLRLLSAYHPDSILPIASSDHIGYFLKLFDVPSEAIPPASQPIARLLNLMEVYESAKTTFNEKLTPYGFIQALYSDELNIRPVTDKKGLSKPNKETDETPENGPMMSLNCILYGPPGTGKTYSTTEQSVQLAEPDWFEELLAQDLSNDEFRKQIKSKYDQLTENARIVFTTFHQSFAYEDFIEGIRANTHEETNEIQYTIEDGVFKKIAEEANRSISGDDTLGLSASPKIWKISIGRRHESELRNRYIQKGEARIGWNLTGDLSLDYDERTEDEQAYWDSLKNKSHASISNFAQNVDIGDVFLCLNDATTVEAIGIVTSDYFYDAAKKDDEDKHYAHARKVNWLFTGIEFNILPINKQKRLVQQTFYPLNRISWNDITTELQNQGFQLPALQAKANSNIKPNYVIIIDEINRGNIARIFGELITLLEPDKRQGAQDARTVVLPYSKQEFTVPDNLYVLGTMNTADKSLEQLDLALRRRFEFIELLPQPELLNDIHVFDCQISELLSVINQRIEVLLDREHLIGHSYFWPLKQLSSEAEKEAELARIFEKNIIPLLQEYFFSDWERISWVLNDIDKPVDEQFIQLTTSSNSISDLFSAKVASGLSDRRYSINQAALSNPRSYQGILPLRKQN